MPTAPPRPCRYPGCPALTHTGYCSTHETARLQAQRRPDDRPSAAARGYDRKWRALRDRHLREHPLCSDCLSEGIYKSADQVHHIIKVTADRSRRLDRTNLLSLCERHHSIRTANGE